MELKNFAPIFALLLAIGIIFGSYNALTYGEFGFEWFTDMLWFVVGTTALIIIGLWMLAAAEVVEVRLAKE